MNSGDLCLDIQRKHATVFRIRLGDKNDRGFPQKLTNAIRVTSPNQAVVAAFAEVYGGEVKAWEQQWEAYLPTMALPVMVLPGQSIYQRWELYKKSVCERRCNGEVEELSGQPCVCPTDITERMATAGACRPMTRINIACPEVAVVGAGSLVTHGLIAAETLPQSVAIAEAALSRGLMVPAVLRVIVHEGKKHYVVPQLEIVGVSLAQLETGEVDRPVLTAAPAPAPAVSPPAPRAIAAPSRSTSSSPRHPVAAPPLPGEDDLADDFTLVALTGRIDKFDDEHKAIARQRWVAAKLPAPTDPAMTQAQADAANSLLLIVEDEAVATYDRRRKHVLAKMGEAGIKSSDARHEFVSQATSGRTESTKRLSQADVDAIVAEVQRLVDEEEARVAS